MRREDSRKELIISSETVLDPMFVITSGCAQTLLKIYDGLQSTEKDTITQIYNDLYINNSTVDTNKGNTRMTLPSMNK